LITKWSIRRVWISCGQQHKSKQLTDVEFLVAERAFSADRFIVSSRSPVFAAMFSDKEMIEANTGMVTINDTATSSRPSSSSSTPAHWSPFLRPTTIVFELSLINIK
jgi:hypothetical protein